MRKVLKCAFAYKIKKEFDHREVTLFGEQDDKIQLLSS